MSLHNYTSFILAACALATPIQADSAYAYFADGDRISGQLLPSNNSNKLMWNNSYLTEPAEINLDRLLAITVSNDPSNVSDSGIATLSLTNGDNIIGDIKGLDDTHVTLFSPIYGEISVRRRMVRDIYLKTKQTLTYSGPASMEDWATTPDNSWRFDQRSYISDSKIRGSISREFELSDRFSFSFIASWKNRLNMQIRMLSDDLNADEAKNCYILNINSKHINLRRRIDDGSNFDRGLHTRAISVSEIAQRESARIEIQFDRREGKIILKVNDKWQQEWTDDELLSEKFGNIFSFTSEGDYSARISEIKSKTLGLNNKEIDLSKISPLIPREVDDAHYVVLTNGDLVRGKIIDAKNSILKMESQNLPINIPMERIHFIRLAPKPYDEAKREKGDIRAYYNNDQYITFRLEGFRDGKITGYSQAFGTADFEMAAFSKLMFNIYNYRFEKLRKPVYW